MVISWVEWQAVFFIFNSVCFENMHLVKHFRFCSGLIVTINCIAVCGLIYIVIVMSLVFSACPKTAAAIPL